MNKLRLHVSLRPVTSAETGEISPPMVFLSIPMQLVRRVQGWRDAPRGKAAESSSIPHFRAEGQPGRRSRSGRRPASLARQKVAMRTVSSPRDLSIFNNVVWQHASREIEKPVKREMSTELFSCSLN